MRVAGLAAAMIGTMAGLGAYTFHYASGLSYFSNDPAACANCHVMREYLDSWQKSSHHARAVCNDCHTPHALIPKLITKAENGWNHSVKFTLQDYPVQLRITGRNRERLRHNCVGCHDELVAEIDPHREGPAAKALDCMKCHSDVGHGPRR